ncbi:MAG TPA: hypothetical protein VFZ08_13725, partial [Terriglobia bacterium]|nr:hypothetical protein [Terriglobia bacterium]
MNRKQSCDCPATRTLDAACQGKSARNLTLSPSSWIFQLLTVGFVALFLLAPGAPAGDLKFEISFPATVHKEPITGRVFIMISRRRSPQPRLQVGNWGDAPPLFGKDVEQLAPGQAAVIDSSSPGYPLRSLRDFPAGDYYVQALINIYTQFHRSDGH